MAAALSAEGEEALQHLGDVDELSSIFEPCLLISPHGKTLDTIRGRLAETKPRLERWEPGEDLPSRVRRLAEEVGKDASRPIIWLQQRHFDRDPWRMALASLNRRREFYRAEAPWTWVLAGPPELVSLVHEYAMHVLTGVAVRLNVMTEPTDPLRWLHLSDFHFRDSEPWERRAILQALLRHAAELDKRNLRPDFVCITGDIASTGRQSEYEQAEHFLTELSKTLNLDPWQDFFLVPGNHDVDRRAIGVADRLILKGLTSQAHIEDLQDDARAMGFLGRRLDAFYSFTQRFLGPARGWRAEQPWRVDVREVNGVEIGILQLNSAWASSSDGDRGMLLIGEAQLRTALEDAADAYLKIALVHHPLIDLADKDRERATSLLGAGDVHFLLRGHLENTYDPAGSIPDCALVELSAGATYDARNSNPAIHLLSEVDLAAGDARIHYFRYSSEGRGFWIPDSTAHKNAADGVWTFPLPYDLHLATRESKTQARHDTLIARYRAATATVDGTVRFVGFAGHRPQTNVSAQDLFVPVHLKPLEEPGGDSAPWTVRDLFHRLTHEEGPARIVVLGGVGSGKTMLCRFLTSLAEHEAPQGFAADDSFLPLFLSVREYARRHREAADRSIVAFLAEQARSRLRIGVNTELFEQTLRHERVVLLLDGLDEAGTTADREQIRARLEEFCHDHAQASVLVTSRAGGYDRTILAKCGTGAFIHLVLEPFDDGDLRRFLERWYDVQEPQDPVTRDHRVADLVVALEDTPRLQELARLPLLATLMALVQRNEVHFPGEHANFYDTCIKTLLEAWPAARRIRFREIDPSLQHVHLEALAYRMQSIRRRDEQEVTIDRVSLGIDLLDIVRERAPDVDSRIIDRWISFLDEGSGLLVKQRPGSYGFLDRSLAEYLAACWLSKLADGPRIISAKHRDPAWRETCLLTLAIRATDGMFLDRVFLLFSGQDDSEGWSFLLQSLTYEVDFDEGQRAVIMRSAARGLLARLPDEWEPEQRTFDRLLRRSLRHAEWARIWLDDELAVSQQEALQAIVAISMRREKEVLAALRQRPDATVAAACLLDFRPDTAVGHWAAGAVDVATAIKASRNVEPKPIRWLHLSDMHLGGHGQDLWWQTQEKLRESVIRMVRRLGAPDLILITGDLSYTGSAAEFALVDRFLDTLLDWIRETIGGFGDDPLVVPVPGNHDLSRPHGPATLAYRVLDHYLEGATDNEDVRLLDEMLWDTRDASFLAPFFAAYTEWFERRIRPDLEQRASSLHVSHFPGDFTVELEPAGTFPVAVVGLNSAWLQYHSGSFKGRLAIPPGQFHAALPGIDETPFDVFRRTRQALLLMHHPPSWLSSYSRRVFNESINPPQRFALCLHGHGHESREKASFLGEPRNYFQGSSLFSLERYGAWREERAVGLSWGSLTADGVVRVWPPRRILRGDGTGALVRDSAFHEDPDGVRIRLAHLDLRSYLEDVLARVGNIDIRSVSTVSARRHVIERLYSPLRYREVFRNASGERIAINQTPARLTDVLPLTKRLLVEGQPGAGKTTFLRFVAAMLARDLLEIPHQGYTGSWSRRYLGFDRGEELVPVFVNLVELAAGLRDDSSSKRRDDCSRILDFVVESSEAGEHGIDRELWRTLLEEGRTYLLLDGLDEVVEDRLRQRLFDILRDTVRVWPVPVVVTSRPTRTGELLEMGFAVTSIEPLGQAEIRTFLDRWVVALHDTSTSGRLSTEGERYRRSLIEAILSRPRIRALATNPLMLTCLSVVHWDQGRLPEGRASVYRAILAWLLAARRSQRKAAGYSDLFALRALARLALAMAAGKRKRYVLDLEEAAVAVDDVLRRESPNLTGEDRRYRARCWLRFECLGSGVVEEVAGGRVRFWHLAFQEYLAALQLAWRGDGEDEEEDWWPAVRDRLNDTQWRETIELLPVCLLEEGGVGRVDRLFGRVLAPRSDDSDLATETCIAGIVGRLLATLGAHSYTPHAEISEAYEKILAASMAIFTLEGAARVPVKDRIAAAEALGRGGDPRLQPGRDSILEVPGIGMRLGKYPVTVEEYQRFVESRGYEDDRYWGKHGWALRNTKGWDCPGHWDEQLGAPNRPVVEVSWYEAMAYCRWLSRQREVEVRLPTTAEWQKAATSPTGEYPWGSEDPDPERANYDGNVMAPTPVGIYPAGDGPYGHSDLAGNVWEWCVDEMGMDVDVRVHQGGSWFHAAESLRTTDQSAFPAVERDGSCGFRIARSEPKI